MKTDKWYQKSFRRLLVDMHIPDWTPGMMKDFSPENYAEMMKIAHVDCAEIYAGNCLGLCFWPTKVGYRHNNLNGRDIFGETLEACRKRGIKTIAYLNVWNRTAYDRHLEWRMIMKDGKGSVEHYTWRFGLCCSNTPYRDYFLSLLSELNSSYDFSGVWIDMIGWFQNECQCPCCEKRFRSETGFSSIPKKEDWNNPAWNAFQECRRKWLEEFAASIYDTVKKQTPNRSVVLQSASVLSGWRSGIGRGFIRSTDYLAGDFAGNRFEQSYICKLFSALSNNRPMEFMTPRCEDLAHHTTGRTYENLLMRSYAAIANQAAFTIIDAIDPAGTLDVRFYKNARKINASFRRYEKYLSPDSVPLCDLAVYCGMGANIEPINTTSYKSPGPRVTGENIAATLMNSHLLFTYVNSDDYGKFTRYPVIVLSDCARLSDADCDAIKKYVADGGKIYASFNTSLYDPLKGMRSDFRLADVFGVHYAGKHTVAPSYITPCSEKFPGNIERRYPLMLNSYQLHVEADPDAEVLAKLTCPCSDAKELNRFGSAISNPPMTDTDFPSVVHHRYGKGESIYVAGNLEEVPFELHRNVFVGLIRKLNRNSILTTNLPSWVEVTYFDQPGEKCLVISLLNLPTELPPAALYDLKFSLRLPRNITAKKFLLTPDDIPYPFKIVKNSIEFNIACLTEFMLLILKYECSEELKNSN